MTGKNALVAVAVIATGAAVTAASLYFRRDKTVVVTTEVIRSRDLEAVVSASGKIQPKRLVNISADTPGRVVNLAVNEGDRVKKGQFLLQIDPKSLRTRVDSGAASLEAGLSRVVRARSLYTRAISEGPRGVTSTSRQEPSRQCWWMRSRKQWRGV